MSFFITPSFSNIGVVDPGIADFGGVPIRDMIPAGPMTSPPHFVLGSSITVGGLFLSGIRRS